MINPVQEATNFHSRRIDEARTFLDDLDALVRGSRNNLLRNDLNTQLTAQLAFIADEQNGRLVPLPLEVQEVIPEVEGLEEANPRRQRLEDRVRGLDPAALRGFLNEIHLQPMPNRLVRLEGGFIAAARAPITEIVERVLRSRETARQNRLQLADMDLEQMVDE